jgi:ribosomal protein S1
MSDEHLTPVGTEPGANGDGDNSTPDNQAPVSATATESVPEQPGPIQPEQSPTPAPSDPAPPTEAKPKDLDEFETAVEAFAGGETGTPYDDTFRPLRRGETLTATVIQVDDTGAFVDLGTKAEGKIPLEELGVGIEKASDAVKVGDQIKVVVMQTDSPGGNPIVSKRRADFQATWDRLVEDFEANRMIKGFVISRVKGGLEVDVGVRGFVPGSHVGSGKKKNLDRFVGQSISLKIIDIDKERKKVVLSNRQAEDELREVRKKELFDRIRPGEIMEGTVRRIVDYGAFVDLGGGVDGLLHISEMAWSRVDHPREVLREGAEVKVMVLRLDPASGRISLGRRQVLPDPWAEIKDHYSVGNRLKLPISRVVQSGAFVKLSEGAEAFIPASEMAHRRVNRPAEIVEPGQEVEVQVIELKPEERRMVLSMRALLPYEARPQREDHTRYSGGERGGRGRDRRRGGGRQESADGGRGATIGERLGALRGFMSEDAEEEAPAEVVEESAEPTAAEAEEQPAGETTPEPTAEEQQ